MLVHELKKLVKIKLILISLAVALIVNGVIAYRQARLTEQNRIADGKTMEIVYSEYSENPVAIEDYYDELNEYRKNQIKIKKIAKETGSEFVETRQSRWTTGLYTDDIKLIEEIHKFIVNQSNYPDEIETYIKNTEINIRELKSQGCSDDGYEIRNQEKAGKLYTAVGENVELHTVFINGWEDFYSYSFSGILSVLISIIIGTAVFIYEKETGMLPVLKSASKGRFVTATYKLSSSLVISAVCTVILALEAFVIIAVFEGYNGGGEALQSLDIFRKSPLIISIRGYFALYLAQRLLAAAVITLVAALISVCFYNYIISFAASTAFVGVNLAMYASGGSSGYGVAKYMNLYSLLDGKRLFLRYLSLNFLDYPVAYYTVAIVLAISLLAVLVVLTTAVFARAGGSTEMFFIKSAQKRKITKSITDGKKRHINRLAHNLSLMRHEMFKIFIASRLGIIVAIILISGIALFCFSEPFTREYGYTDKLYYSFLSDYSGEWSYEKHTEILATKEKYDSIISEQSGMVAKLEQGIIIVEEYNEHTKKYILNCNSKLDTKITKLL